MDSGGSELPIERHGDHAVVASYSLVQLTWYALKLGTIGFGGPVALVGYMYRDARRRAPSCSDRDSRWCRSCMAASSRRTIGSPSGQFVDAVAVAMITPGPVVITVGFVGYLIAGLSGATVAALATFLPCYLFTILPAPYFKKYGKLPGLIAFVDGVTAAAIGAIAGAVIVLSRRSIVDVPTAALAIATAALLWRFKKLPEPLVVAAAAAIGLAVYPLVRH